jgi:integrase
VRWYDKQGRVHREKAGTKSAARQLYTLRSAAVLEDRKLPRLRRREVTVGDLVEQFQPEILQRNKRSAAEYVRHAKTWQEALGHRPAHLVTAGEIETWKAAQTDWAGSTVNGCLRYLKMLYNLALRDDLVERNPLARGRVKLAPEANPRDRILSPEEEARLEATLPRPFWLQVQIALQTGLRQSEQFGTLRRSVHLEKRLLFLPTAKGEKRGQGQWVKLNSLALAAFCEVLATGSGQWVWPNQYGTGPLDGTSVTKKLQRHCSKLGLPPGITWHALRHTFISRLCMLGVPLPTVQKMARHKSITMTLRYAHLCPDHEDEALEQLTRFRGNSTLNSTPGLE